MAIWATVEPLSKSGITSAELAPDEHFFYDIDRTVGRLLVAYSVGMKYAEVIEFKDVTCPDSELMNPWTLYELVQGEQPYATIQPFFACEEPTHFDSGGPAWLTMRFLPKVELTPIGIPSYEQD